MSSKYDVRIITTREGYDRLSKYMENRFMEEDMKYKVLKHGLKLLEEEGYIYTVTKNVNIAECIEEYKYIPSNIKNFQIPSVPLTYEFDDAETRMILKSTDDYYSEICNEMECDLE